MAVRVFTQHCTALFGPAPVCRKLDAVIWWFRRKNPAAFQLRAQFSSERCVRSSPQFAELKRRILLSTGIVGILRYFHVAFRVAWNCRHNFAIVENKRE
jgi:hypothetical protein